MFLHVSVILSTLGVLSQHALQVVSQHALQQVSGGGVVSQHAGLQVSRPTPGGKLRGIWLGGLQAHTQGGSWGGSGQGEGLQAHTQGGSWGGSGQGDVSRPTPGGLQAHTQGGVSRPTPGGVSWPTPRGVSISACTETDPPDGYCCGRYASYWNAFLLQRMLSPQFVNQDLTKLSFITSFAKDVNIKNRLGFHNQTYLDSQLLELNKNCN